MDSATPTGGFTGWILPNGTRLKCAPGWHGEVAAKIGERHPDKAGWVHCNDGVCDPTPREPTKAQITEMRDMLGKLPQWVRDWL